MKSPPSRKALVNDWSKQMGGHQKCELGTQAGMSVSRTSCYPTLRVLLIRRLTIGGLFSGGLLGENYKSFDFEVNSKEAAWTAVFGFETAGDEELVPVRTAKGHVAGRAVPAVVAGQQFALRAQHLHFFHAVMHHIEVAGRIQAHSVGLVVLPAPAFVFGQIGEDLGRADFAR